MKQNVLMSLDEFKDTMERIQGMDALLNDVDEVFRKHGSYIEVDGLPGQDLCIELLGKIFHDVNGWIPYWIYDLEYGNEYRNGWVTEADGTTIPLKTSEDLYRLLVRNLNEMDGDC